MRTPITYYGGKQTLLPDILPLIPKHDLYTEAFCGGAAVLFAKRPAPAEIINDLNSYLITFYRVMKLRHHDLKARIDATIHARDHHEHANHILSFPAFFDEVDIAWAIWVVSKMSSHRSWMGRSDTTWEELCQRKLRTQSVPLLTSSALG